MTSRPCSPAIYAGLAGAVALGAPKAASALTLFGHELPSYDTGVAFVAGCVVGAVVASGAFLVFDRGDRRGAKRAGARNVDGAPVSQAARASVPVSASVPAQPSSATAAPAAPAASVTSATQPSQLPLSERIPGFPVVEDYAAVAQDYVNTLTLAERMATRAKGVANVLAERLGASRMEGLPVITRADGTVGDVGEVWWDAAFEAGRVSGAATPSRSAILAVPEVPAAPSVSAQMPAAPSTSAQVPAAPSVSAQPSAPQPSAPATPAPVVQPPAPASRPSVAQEPVPFAQPASEPAVRPSATQTASPAPAASTEAHPEGRTEISTRVADPAEAFPTPEERWTDEQQDLWQVALDALDERIAEQIGIPDNSMSFERQVFGDEVVDAGEGELDDPSGIEPSTSFMSFKPQANHPEVTDTDCYIELLVNQELSQARSASVRKSFRDYLRVIDGGTSTLRGTGDKTSKMGSRPFRKQGSKQTGDQPRGKHFAKPKDKGEGERRTAEA